MAKSKTSSGEIEAARRGGREGLINLFGAMIETINRFDERPLGITAQRTFEFNEEPGDELKKVEKEKLRIVEQKPFRPVVRVPEPVKNTESIEWKFFEECVEVVPVGETGIIWQPDLASNFINYCKARNAKVWSPPCRLSVELRKWLKLKLPLPVEAGGRGFNDVKTSEFLLEANFYGRETKRMKERPRYYKGIRFYSVKA